jgi:hypothetical protein
MHPISLNHRAWINLDRLRSVDQHRGDLLEQDQCDALGTMLEINRSQLSESVRERGKRPWDNAQQPSPPP